MRVRAIVSAVLVLVLSGCSGWQSALDTQGPQADALGRLFWIFLGVLAAVWITTMAALLLALRRRRPIGEDPLATHALTERRMTVVVSAAVALTFVIVVALTGLSYGGQKALFSHKDGAITLKITGRQWWWEVVYEDSEPYRSFTTANEIRIPVGEKVLIKLESSDVIHSLWVPSLAGKLDLIPGRQNQLEIQADRPGIYRGQCAEFCGWQHAHMGFLVVAEGKGDFERWREGQISAARPPDESERQRGMEIFMSKPCVMCHSIRGTTAGGRVGPDLTHVGSRQYIAAGTLPNTRGNLAAWIVDPQGIKPGVHMPLVQLEPEEVQPLATYLESLK
jgi:cytochrome c oxidase subunit 2